VITYTDGMLLYGKAHLAFHLNVSLSDIVGDECHSVLNVLASLNVMGLSRSI
jgi:hypothetical protein